MALTLEEGYSPVAAIRFVGRELLEGFRGSSEAAQRSRMALLTRGDRAYPQDADAAVEAARSGDHSAAARHHEAAARYHQGRVGLTRSTLARAHHRAAATAHKLAEDWNRERAGL